MFRVLGGLSVNVNAEVLAEHLEPPRARFVPFLKELLTDPYEVWLSFQQHKGTGKVELRARIIKAIDSGGKNKGQLLVAQVRKGQLEAWTIVPGGVSYMQQQRQGKLIFGRD